MKCSWCGAAIEDGQSACPRCGVMLNSVNGKMHSGWAKLPGRKDMAKLQFGNSTCQIEGKYVPAADLKLAAEDWVTFAHHVLLWRDPSVAVTAIEQNGPWKALAGPTRLMMEARGPGHIAFSENHPGELITLPLEPGQKIHVRQQAQSLKQERSTEPQKHLFLAATGNVTYTWFDPNVWFHTGGGALEEDHHYPVGKKMDVFSAKDKPGLLLLHAAGNVFVRQLAAGQHILVKPAALVFKDSTVKMDLYYESPKNGFVGRGTGYIWLRLHGPGRAAIQSVFERVEGEEEFSKRANRHSTMYPLDPPAPAVVPALPKIQPAKQCLIIGFTLALIAFLVVWIRRASLPAGSGMNSYESIIVPVAVLVMLSVPFLLCGFGFWIANVRLRRDGAKKP